MLNPLKWKYESQVGMLVSTIGGAGSVALAKLIEHGNVEAHR
jgi:hypothetical protein